MQKTISIILVGIGFMQGILSTLLFLKIYKKRMVTQRTFRNLTWSDYNLDGQWVEA